MALNMTQEQKKTGQENFNRVAAGLKGMDRREFMKTLALTSGVVVPVGAAAYFMYSREGGKDNPVRTGLIGGGDEGGVLMSEHNPEFVQIVAVADIRPSNRNRIFVGGDVVLDEKGKEVPKPNKARKGLNAI